MQSLVYNESLFGGPHGHVKVVMHRGGYFDEEKQGFTPDTEIVAVEEDNNLIVNIASVFMARRMFAATSLTDGLTYLAVGTGIGTGTTQNPQAEVAIYTQLRTEIYRKLFAAKTYLDASGNATDTPTSRVQFTTTFLEGEANGALVEMGLFGGNATSTANSGYMFNYKVFPVINKDTSLRITIIWEIQF